MPRRWWRTWARRWSEVLPGAQGTRGGASRSLRSHLHVIADGHRRMVRELHILVDVLGACQCGDGRGGQVVVQAPSHVVGIGLASVAPPCVAGVRGVGLEQAINIRKTARGIIFV